MIDGKVASKTWVEHEIYSSNVYHFKKIPIYYYGKVTHKVFTRINITFQDAIGTCFATLKYSQYLSFALMIPYWPSVAFTHTNCTNVLSQYTKIYGFFIRRFLNIFEGRLFFKHSVFFFLHRLTFMHCRNFI